MSYFGHTWNCHPLPFFQRKIMQKISCYSIRERIFPQRERKNLYEVITIWRKETRHLFRLMGDVRLKNAEGERFTFYVKPSSRLTLFCLGKGSTWVVDAFSWFCHHTKYFIACSVYGLTRHISENTLFQIVFVHVTFLFFRLTRLSCEQEQKKLNILEKETNKSEIVDKATLGI